MYTKHLFGYLQWILPKTVTKERKKIYYNRDNFCLSVKMLLNNGCQQLKLKLIKHRIL